MSKIVGDWTFDAEKNYSLLIEKPASEKGVAPPISKDEYRRSMAGTGYNITISSESIKIIINGKVNQEFIGELIDAGSGNVVMNAHAPHVSLEEKMMKSSSARVDIRMPTEDTLDIQISRGSDKTPVTCFRRVRK